MGGMRDHAMLKPTLGTYFSGGGIGLAELKGKVDFAFGVEYDPAISEVYRANISDRIITARVQDVDVTNLERVDLFQVSPVCKEFSAAKTGGKESAEEISQAAAICRYLDYHKPPYFLLENVRGYIKSKSFQMIVVRLTRLGYTCRFSVENSADYGVPQTRERLILRAAIDRPLPSLPDYAGRWIGWYEAIEDLIPSLPESKFGDWQLARMPFNKTFQSLLVGNESNRDENIPVLNTRIEREPAITIKADSRSRVKAILMPGANASNENYYRFDDEPMVTVAAGQKSIGTVRAFIVGQDSKCTTREREEPLFTLTAEPNREYIRAWLSQGRVVQMTPRALARFQSIPDCYRLPDKNGLACTVIGNGIPSRMGARIIEAMLGLNDSEIAA
jgi:DNA-cytosine methyltransferase